MSRVLAVTPVKWSVLSTKTETAFDSGALGLSSQPKPHRAGNSNESSASPRKNRIFLILDELCGTAWLELWVEVATMVKKELFNKGSFTFKVPAHVLLQGLRAASDKVPAHVLLRGVRVASEEKRNPVEGEIRAGRGKVFVVKKGGMPPPLALPKIMYIGLWSRFFA